MGLFKSRNILRISPTDTRDNYLINKFRPGENVDIDIEQSPYGEQFVITANKSQGRRVRKLKSDGVVNADEYLVMVDASENHVVVALPPARDFLGQLHIVCVDPTHGIEIITNQSTSNIIYDTSNIAFNAKGDALILVSDRGWSPPPADPDEDPADIVLEGQAVEEDVPYPGTWFVCGRYAALWYA